MHCDCHIRPLSHFYRTVMNMPSIFTDIICHSPESSANKPLYQITDDNLNCANKTESMTIREYDVLPDITFREIFL